MEATSLALLLISLGGCAQCGSQGTSDAAGDMAVSMDLSLDDFGSSSDGHDDASVECSLAAPGSIAFGSIAVGQQPQQQQLKVTNCNQVALDPVRIVIGGANPGEFKFVNPGPFLLDPKQSRLIPIWYAPTSAEVHSATLSIRPTGFPSADVALSGKGI
jgi:hypothetical protein